MNLDLLETKYLAGIQLTESEMIALQEGPRWDAIKKGTGALAKGTGALAKGAVKGVAKGIGAVGQGIGAVAGVPQGVGRAMAKGYRAGVDTVGGPKVPPAATTSAPAATTSAPAANSKIGQMIQQINALTPAEKQQVVKAVSGGSAAGGSASAPASGSAPKQAAAPAKNATPAKQQMKLPNKPGEIVTYTNNKGELVDGEYVGKTNKTGKIVLKKGNAMFTIAPQQIIGSEPTPTTDQGTLGDIQKARGQAGISPKSTFKAPTPSGASAR